jgi:hypothetical protein
MKKILIPVFAMFLSAAVASFGAAQNKGSIKQEGKETGAAAGDLGKNTAKVAVSGTKTGLRKASSGVGKAAHKLSGKKKVGQQRQ